MAKSFATRAASMRAMVILLQPFAVANGNAQPQPEPPAKSQSSPEIPGLKTMTLDRFAPSGTDQKIAFLSVVNPDCTTSGTITPRIIAKPQHGEVSFSNVEDFSYWTAPNPREKCNTQKVKGLRITYKSLSDYVGQDSVTVLCILPDGLALQYDISIGVM